MADLSIRDILNQISKGNLRIPAFQREFVWEADSIAFLMDSIYKGYPFGTIQLWRTKEKLTTEKKFGPFEIFERDKQYPIDYVLDGQQRITSIFGVFQTELSPINSDNRFKIYYDLQADENSQDSQFLVLDASEVDSTRHFPLNCLFDTVGYRRATEHLEEKIVEKIDVLQSIFKEVKIPYQTLETDDKTKVAIVFERINRKGIPLDTLQLLTAWTWSEEFDLPGKFNSLAIELEPMGFKELSDNPDLLLKICSAVLTHDNSYKSLIELNGNTVRNRFSEITNGIKGSIDFLKKNIKIEKLSNLPFDQFLIPLSVFFSNKENKHFNYTDEQRKILISWFWKTSISKRYNSAPNKTINRDISEIVKLKKNDKDCKLDHLNCEVTTEIFTSNKFSMNTVLTKTFILILAQNDPRSLLNGSNLTLSQVLKDYNKNEFHHIYPKSYLNKKDSLSFDVNCLANYCILSRADNKKIDCKKPSEYRVELMPSNSDDIFTSNFIDEATLIADNFNEFIKIRSTLLSEYAKFLIN